MNATRVLLRPRRLILANRWKHSDSATKWQAVLFVALGIGLWTGIFVFFLEAVEYLRGIPDLGPILAERLLGIALVTFFSILLFSNVITALSSYFLAFDLPLLLAAPIPRGRLHVARFLETLWDSSWMILIFGVPIFLAYGIAYEAGPRFYLATAAVLPPFVVIPCAIGVTLTMLLVRFFPARRTKDVFLFLSIAAAGGLFVLLRFLMPEQLDSPDAFESFLEFVTAVRSPAPPWIPSTWAVQALTPFLTAEPTTSWIRPYAYLVIAAATGSVACAIVGHALYAAGWSRAQEGRRAFLTRASLWDQLATRFPVSPPVRALIVKDAKTFFRDPTQWSQLILLLSLIVVYVYNFSVLPTAEDIPAQLFLDQALSFLNLALGGFVVTSIAVRFLFPGISLEGKAFWVLRSAPIHLRTLWWSKFWSHTVPLLVVGTILVALGSRALDVGFRMTIVSVGTLWLMTFAIAALGLSMSSMWPRFDYEHAAKIPATFGGLVYMLLAIGVIAANVALEAWPMYAMIRAETTSSPLAGLEQVGIALSACAVLALNGGIFAVATRIGIRRLEALEA